MPPSGNKVKSFLFLLFVMLCWQGIVNGLRGCPARGMMPPVMLTALAPMQDVTDLAFLRTLSRIGSLPDLLVTPYFRSTATTCALAEANLRLIEGNETGVPLLAQLAGSEPAALVRDARALLRLPVAGINLNVGCPSPLVNRHGAGAALLRNLNVLQDIMLALREVAPPGMFSVKCRLGWMAADEFPAILATLAAGHPDMVMVHARTRRQLYGGHPHEGAVREAVRYLSCAVLGNGDIATLAQARHWLEGVTPAGVMVGRGAVRNPYLFRMLKGGPAPTKQEMQLYYDTLVEETGRLMPAKSTEASHCNRMKKYLSFCYADFKPEAEYALRRCSDREQMLQLLHGGGIGAI